MSLELKRIPQSEKSFYNIDDGLVFEKIIGYLGDRAICNLRVANSKCNNFITHQLNHNPNALDRVLRLYTPTEAFPLEGLVNRVRSQLFETTLSISEIKVNEIIANFIGEDMEESDIDARGCLDLLGCMKKGNICGKYEFSAKIINQLIYLNNESDIDPQLYPNIIAAVLELGKTIPTNEIPEVKSLRYSLFSALDSLVTDAFAQEDEEDDEITDAAQLIIDKMGSILKMIESVGSFTSEGELVKDTRIKCLQLLINLIEAGKNLGVESISEDIHGQLSNILPLMHHIFTHIDDQNLESMNYVIEFLYELDQADHIDEKYFNDICNLLKDLPKDSVAARSALITVVREIYGNSVSNYGTPVALSKDNLLDILNFFKQSQNQEKSRFISLDLLTHIYIKDQDARIGIEAEVELFLNIFKSLDPHAVKDKKERNVFIELFNKMSEYSPELKQKLIGKY